AAYFAVGIIAVAIGSLPTMAAVLAAALLAGGRVRAATGAALLAAAPLLALPADVPALSTATYAFAAMLATGLAVIAWTHRRAELIPAVGILVGDFLL